MVPRRTLFLSSVFGAIGAIVPIVIAVYLSWLAALTNESDRLAALGHQVIERVEGNFREISDILHGLGDSDHQPCSQPHISELRRLTIDSPVIREIGYVEGGVLRCTSWGITEIEVRQGPHDFETRSGLAVVASIAPLVTQGRPITAVRFGSYNALAHPARMVDILAEPQLMIAVAHAGGTVLAARDGSSAELLRTAMQGETRAEFRDLIVSTVSSGEWIAALSAPVAAARAAFLRQLLMFVPIGAILGGLVGATIYFFVRKRWSAAGELVLAVRRRQFIAHYQPIIELSTGRCVGAEALVRWRKEDGSLVAPNAFLPAAEEAGLLQAITDQVVESVVGDLRAMLKTNRNFHVSINFAAADIQSGRVPDMLEKSLQGTGIEPGQIWLEATERTLMDMEPAREAMTRVRSLGSRIIIDDFGTGYSSLQYLSSLPIDGVKIDKSFLDAIGKEAATSSVTLYIIQMAKALDLFIIAEGVERQEQAEYLMSQGVEFAQGWLYSKALPAPIFLAFLAQAPSR